MAQGWNGRLRQVETVSQAKTLDEGDSGVVQNVTATATVTLPATTAGMFFVIRNGGDESVTVTVSPNASDKIMGNGFTSADDKDAVNTLGQHGDELALYSDGTHGWGVAWAIGTWTRQA